MTPPDLQAITARLGLFHKQWKDSEKAKGDTRDEFFTAATESVSCDERLIEIEATSKEEAIAEIEKRHPLWRVDDVRCVVDNRWEAIIIERPEFKKFTYFNPDTKMIYERQIAQGAPSLDDERLQEENPDLYARVTYVPEPKRQLRPLEDLADEDLAALQDYVFEGKPSVRLASPRKASEEELSELE